MDAETAESPGQKRFYCPVFRDYRARTALVGSPNISYLS
jgi:hypothetical protein